MKTIHSFVCILFLCACTEKLPKEKVCTEEARAGITITVKDIQTGIVLCDSMQVLVADGTYTESLQFFSSNPAVFTGAWERPGTYVVTLSKSRYKTLTSSPIMVTKDDCHVLTQTHTISLQAN